MKLRNWQDQEDYEKEAIRRHEALKKDATELWHRVVNRILQRALTEGEKKHTTPTSGST